MGNESSSNGISVINRRFPALADMIKESDDSFISVVLSKNGSPVPEILQNNRKIFLHSKYEPMVEAERFIGDISLRDFNLIIVFGFAFAYHLEVILSKMDNDAILLVIEKNPEIIKSAVAHRNLDSLLDDPRLILMINPTEDNLSDFFYYRSSAKVTFIIQRGSAQIDGSYYENLKELSQALISKKDVNLATMVKFEKVWSANIARNAVRFMKSAHADIFYDQFRNVPAIIIAAGPSLIKSLDSIRAVQNKAILIAVDTTMLVLEKAGITPHFCLSVDAQLINARYFEGLENDKTILITDPAVHPSVYRLYKGPVASAGMFFPVYKYLESISGNSSELSYGGSVSTNAYDFACRLGASPVIMVGQDLAFTEGHAHVPGSYFESQFSQKNNRFQTLEVFNRRQLYALPPIYLPAIDGGRVATNQKMLIFKSWLEKKARPDSINATANGAKLDGFIHQTLDTLNFGEPAAGIHSTVSEIFKKHIPDDYRNKLEKLESDSRTKLKELDTLIRELERAIKWSDELVREFSGDRSDRGRVEYLLKKLNEVDQLIEKSHSIKDQVGFTVQRVLHTITEGYDLEKKEFRTSEEEVAARSYYLYKGLLEGALYTRKIIGKMLKLTRMELDSLQN